MSRFFVTPDMVGDKSILITSKSDIQHMTKVLRLREGAEIDISDSEAWEYKCRIEYMDKNEVEAVILDKQKFAREPAVKVTLFQGVPKQSKMDLIVQKTVELGVSKVVPVFMDRTVISDKGKIDKKIERYNTIGAEAAKQCQRGTLPLVTSPLEFSNMVEELENFDLVLFPYENESKTSMKDVLRNLDEKPKSVAVIIGPEGGFSDSEAEILKQHDTSCVSLGKTILRTETAGIVAISMVMYELEM